MIRHVHNASTQIAATNPATRAIAKSNTGANIDSFQSLFDSSTYQSAPASGSAQITATITKPATAPSVPLTPPHYEQGATVTNPDGSVATLNYTQFATPDTAKQIAAKLGGTVSTSTLSGYSVGQLSISVPGSPNLVNAGIAAQLFAQYGDKQGSMAWQIINRDLGRDPMST